MVPEFLGRVFLKEIGGKLRRIEVKEVADPEDIRKLVDVQVSAWGMQDRAEAVPSHVLKAASDNSGIVVAAFDIDTGEALAFAWGFLAMDERGLYHYSHQSAVVDEAKGSGLGFIVKQAQREAAMKRGLRRAKWTFDPLQALNTRFNLGKLGVVSWEYRVNYYGYMEDSINRGLRTDRLKAWWFLDSERVIRKARGELESPSYEDALAAGAEEVIEFDSEGRPCGFRKIDGDLALVEIPRSIEEARARNSVDVWRNCTAEAMIYYMERGYIDFEAVVDKRSGRVFHLLWRNSLDSILSGSSIKFQ
ncbi:hypothetical protein [Candidatus Korarchaeum cryptofilum]|jgi:predicted GNAT superfamily acetyltransferase|uniref:hypothetical protein n=1 Tax=Candidatus Korarchaeum cryptofilum TaxID=498846 RepID=UPI000696A314|nr:hypothetical protein [Candidatus Korarchaeum cryptofilum]